MLPISCNAVYRSGLVNVIAVVSVERTWNLNLGPDHWAVLTFNLAELS
jgi:hypothetical protein